MHYCFFTDIFACLLTIFFFVQSLRYLGYTTHLAPLISQLTTFNFPKKNHIYHDPTDFPPPLFCTTYLHFRNVQLTPPPIVVRITYYCHNTDAHHLYLYFCFLSASAHYLVYSYQLYKRSSNLEITKPSIFYDKHIQLMQKILPHIYTGNRRSC